MEFGSDSDEELLRCSQELENRSFPNKKKTKSGVATDLDLFVSHLVAGNSDSDEELLRCSQDLEKSFTEEKTRIEVTSDLDVAVSHLVTEVSPVVIGNSDSDEELLRCSQDLEKSFTEDKTRIEVTSDLDVAGGHLVTEVSPVVIGNSDSDEELLGCSQDLEKSFTEEKTRIEVTSDLDVAVSHLVTEVSPVVIGNSDSDEELLRCSQDLEKSFTEEKTRIEVTSDLDIAVSHLVTEVSPVVIGNSDSDEELLHCIEEKTRIGVTSDVKVSDLVTGVSPVVIGNSDSDEELLRSSQDLEKSLTEEKTKIGVISAEASHLVPGVSPLVENSDNTESDEDIFSVDRESHESEESTMKRRRIHMDSNACVDHARTASGSQALTDPARVETSSKDPNRGLYPRSKPGDYCGPSAPAAGPGVNFGFQSASSLTRIALPVDDHVGNVSNTFSIGWKKNSVAPVPQKNSLRSYLSDVPSTSPSVRNPPPPEKAESTPPKNVFEMMIANQKSQNADKKTTKRKKRRKTIDKKTTANNRLSVGGGWRTSFSLAALNAETSRGLNGLPPTHVVDLTTINDDSDTDAMILSQAQFGLFGDSADVQTAKRQTIDVNYFESLPREVLELIFCQLPMLDLCLNSNRVCLQWNDILSDEKFVPWKKRYHKLKAGIGNEAAYMNGIIREKCGIKLPSDFLSQLIRFMKDFKRVSSKNMNECLAKHKKYSWARALIAERLDDCIEDGNMNPWCLIAALVVISKTVSDVEEVIACLTCARSQCTIMEVLECLYCIATMLLMFKRIKNVGVWNSIHYRVYYALYLYENSSRSSVDQLQTAFSSNKGQQTILQYSQSEKGLRLTHEQMRIVNHNIDAGETIKIVAFAGTGKTTTLVKYTQVRPSQRFLLIVYNRSMADHAVKIFPGNVTSKTSHSLAYAKFGRMYARKLTGNLKVKEISESIVLKKGMSLFVRAKLVILTINDFCASADRDLTTAHVPLSRLDMNKNSPQLVEVPHEHRMMVLEDAEMIWKRMIDVRDDMKITHDGYLKVYQLSRPKLYNFDCILIDEAQDLTPAIADVLLSQSQGKILVGDPRQQIYAFRGAVNSMQQVQASKIFYLTQSFRFGPEIAQVADCILSALHGERRKNLVGSGITGGIEGDREGQLAIITRSNFTLFKEAVNLCCSTANEEVRVAFVGGAEAFGFNTILDIYALQLSDPERRKGGLQIKHPLIKHFRSLPDLEKYASSVMDNELLGKIRIVRTYNHNLPSHIAKIRSKTVTDQRIADVLFSTAHKSKGLEFDTVRLTDDYNVLPGEGNQSFQIKDDEKNILYVAATRAKKRLQLSASVFTVLQLCGEKFEFPQLSSELEMKEGKLVCSAMKSEFKPKALTLVRQSIKLTERRNREVYCRRVT
ncbi:F-box DNA helicase 1-like isoform X2 [Tubulanus polymorphus]|uniref:F-box DNA helicase 1-like isoform X2 n=1 Tax=Tubulanus polymorphus TaxID=672921 RepID=UPI003DA5FE60